MIYRWRKDWRYMRGYGSSRRKAFKVCFRNLLRRIGK